MKVSFEWLKTLVDLKDLSPFDVSNALNKAGIEVEAITPLSESHLVTSGLVLTQALIEGTNLSKVEVDTGQHGIRTIVCGANNIAQGQKVLVALPGAKLASLTIQKTMIKGVESNGMVCSLSELGIANKYLTSAQLEGIEVLDPSTMVGDDDIVSKLGYKDVYLELKLLANRPDLLAMQNVAIEVSALLQRPLIESKTVASSLKQTLKPFPVSFETDKVKQFSTVVLKNIKSTRTPVWMQSRLMASGIRPIHFLVDVGNYVMMLTGQPIHMYDLDKLPSENFVITDQYQGDFVALDQQTYAIKPGDISILSDGKIMCLAGIMGSLACAVDVSTHSVVIEVAAFDSTKVRKAAHRLHLISDASNRFAKGIDLTQYKHVMHMTIALIEALTEVEAISTLFSLDHLPSLERVILRNDNKINAILGTHFSSEFIEETLLRLKIGSKNDKVIIPSHRVDITTDADLAEEVIRLAGFETIEETPMSLSIGQAGLTEKQLQVRKIKRYLKGLGIDETLSYSLISQGQLTPFSLLPVSEAYAIQNPLTEEHQFVRTSLLYSVLLSAKFNFERQNLDGQYFEISNVYGKEHSRLECAVVYTGHRYQQGMMQARSVDFYHIKGVLEQMLKILKIEPSRYLWKQEVINADFLHPYRSASLYIGQEKIAVIGELSPQGKTFINAGKTNVAVMQLNLSSLLTIKTSQTKMSIFSKYPTVYRDLACVVDTAVPYQSLVQSVKKAGKQMVIDVNVFDIYQGSTIGEGKKSMAIRISLNDPTRTLQEEDILKTMEMIKRTLVEDFSADFRV